MSHPKPCPFCGSTDVTERRIMQVAATNYFVVMCDTCHISGPVPPKEGIEAAVKVWNHRAEEL